MPERKGHGNRGSLMDLGKPRLTQSPLSAPIDEAERLILSAEPRPAAPSETATSLPHPADTPRPFAPAAEDLLAKLRKTRQPIAVVGFKLPARLKDELAAVAQHNGTDMTRIVIEALHRFLPDLPHPPGWDH